MARAVLLSTSLAGALSFQAHPSIGFLVGHHHTSALNLSGKGDSTDVVTEVFDKNADGIDRFCRGTNEFWKGLIIQPVKDYVAISTEPRTYDPKNPQDTFDKLIAPPELPGIPRPVWFTILGSVPTALGWYGYYKFSVEEELFQYEMQSGKKVTGCGGYGTLFPFVFGVILGFPLSFLHVPGGELILQAAGAWILLGQVNLYRRVNELCNENSKELGLSEPPLYSWWALLPPPLDVVVGRIAASPLSLGILESKAGGSLRQRCHRRGIVPLYQFRALHPQEIISHPFPVVLVYSRLGGF